MIAKITKIAKITTFSDLSNLSNLSNLNKVESNLNKVKNKVESWEKDLQSLSKYAQDDPQAAYLAFTKGLSSRWTYFQRTVPDASELFEPLENAIGDQLISALVGREVNDAERQILALPLRHDGLGLTDPRETAKMEYKH